MITIGERVQHALDDVERGQFELGLQHAAIAIDITSKRHYGKRRSSRTLYKNLLHEYAWLLEMMACDGIDLQNSKFGNYPLRDEKILEPSFADLMYYVVRCNLVHAEGLPPNLTFHDEPTLHLAREMVGLPKQVIYGLLGIVVFCPENSDQRAPRDCWLSYHDTRFIINEYWGRVDAVRAAYDRHQHLRVALNLSHEHFFGTPTTI
ncbi:hypothetical protein KBK24_0119220 [Burkholderia sp. K24]|nr:hypothetical protein KBK24_0119220 [Burkholderia sp. K24]